MLNKSDFTNYSGGAIGTDSQFELIGLKYGFNNHKQIFVQGYKTPRGNTFITQEDANKADEHLMLANKTLNRSFPTKSQYVNNLLRRNCYQIFKSEGVFAFGTVQSNMQTLNGGTAWATQLAINKRLPVYVFDLLENRWYYYNYDSSKFLVFGTTPVLSKNYTGIGTRELTKEGRQEIENLYIRTIKHYNLYEQ